MANTVRQLPLNPNVAAGGLASQISGVRYDFNNGQTTSVDNYVPQVASLVTFTRNSQGVTHSTVTGDFTLDEIDEPSFGDLGIQVGPSLSNELNNSDMRNSTLGYTIVDTGGVVVTSTTEDSGLSESDKAFRLTLSNTTGSAKTVSVYQSTTGSINDYWSAQILVEALGSTGTPSAAIRVNDVTNAQIASSSILTVIVDGVYRQSTATHQLTAASSDLRWELYISIADTETLDIRFTNTSFANTHSAHHYIPSVVAPVTRDTDVIDVGTAVQPFFVQPTDSMWSIDFKTLGSLATLSGVSQLQYIFSTYNGVNGTSLFVDDPNTITWRADFNSTFEDVTIALGSTMGVTQFRAYFRILTNGSNYDRQLFLENVTTGAITASSVLTTANLPIAGDVLKLGRDNSDANTFDGFLGRFAFWDNRTNESMNRINSNWPT